MCATPCDERVTKQAGVRAEFFKERARSHLDVLEKARQAVRRAGRVDRYRDAVIMPGRKTRRGRRLGALHDRQIARREEEAGVAIWVGNAPLAAVVDLKAAGACARRMAQTVAWTSVIHDLNTRETG